MKINPLFFIVAIVIVIVSCSKGEDPIVEESPLPVGQWNIVAVDSGYVAYVPNATFRLAEPLNLTGQIEFKVDGSGSLTGDVQTISCNNNIFTWMRNDSLSVFYLIFHDGESVYSKCRLCKCIIQNMQKDTLIFDYQDWCKGGDMRQGAQIFYQVTAVK